MIKIDVIAESNFSEDYSHGYTTDCKFVLSDEATSTDAINMFVNALILDGYFRSSIISSMEEMISDLKENIKVESRVLNDN